MNHLKLLLLSALFGAFITFSGCEEDDDGPNAPDINFKGGSGYVDDDVTLAPGASFLVGITANENSTTGSDLTHFKVTRTGIVDATPVDSSFNDNTFSWEQTLTAANSEGTETWTFIITDDDGETSDVSFTVTTESDSTPLSSAQSFSWYKCGTNNPDLSAWGLEWTENSATAAIIKKDADRLVVLNNTEWTNITTKEGLKAAVDNGTDVADYRGISVTVSDNYNEVIATKKGDSYYILHITSATVDVPTTCGTPVTINGESKN